MSDEYLWSKNGSDAEIEGLEDLLSDFRYVPERAVQIPVSDPVVEPIAARRFRWVFALAAPAFATVLLAVWFAFQSNEGSLRAREQVVDKPQISVPGESTTLIGNTSDTPVAAYKATPTQKASPTIIKTIFRPKSSKRRQIESLVAANKLTKEEKYAYDRLMLALSIAGNKLKVVQDTIDRKSDLDQRSIRNDK